MAKSSYYILNSLIYVVKQTHIWLLTFFITVSRTALKTVLETELLNKGILSEREGSPAVASGPALGTNAVEVEDDSEHGTSIDPSGSCFLE